MRKTHSLICFLLVVSVQFQSIAFAKDYIHWSLPDGATARLGKGAISGNIAYSPDGQDSRSPVRSGLALSQRYRTHTLGRSHPLRSIQMGGRCQCVAFSPWTQSQARTIAEWAGVRLVQMDSTSAGAFGVVCGMQSQAHTSYSLTWRFRTGLRALPSARMEAPLPVGVGTVPSACGMLPQARSSKPLEGIQTTLTVSPSARMEERCQWELGQYHSSVGCYHWRTQANPHRAYRLR